MEGKHNCSEFKLELEGMRTELKVYNQLLETHIKRTDALESYVKDNDENWKLTINKLETFQDKQQRFTLKILVGIGTFAGVVIPLIVTLLNALN